MDGVKIIALNRRARFDYAVEEDFECGVVLLGSEVKSLRMGKVSFPDGYAVIEKGELWLRNVHIAEYTYSSVFNHDPDRPRKLLVHAHELKRLERRVREKGYTLIPLDFHFRKGRVKVEIGLCKGKKFADKRESIKERDVQRDLQRDFRDRQH
ncbi:MAG: SsrA-binding protein [Spirochaetes bacterium RIFOXYC1_FULL_54_7]|nr:MAG: SsrA-binding protein [Spirochaetes bacterium RIFOXYC1_FULL_54_7]